MKNIATTVLKNLTRDHDALKEGWDVFNVDSTGVLDIEAVNEADIFKTDLRATDHVINRAAAGDVEALKALLIILATIAEPVIEQAYRAGALPGRAAMLKLENALSEKAVGTAYRATH